MLTLAAASLLAFAAQLPPGYDPATIRKEASLALPTGRLDYTATAGSLLLRDDKGAVEQRMFAVSYVKKGETVAARPVIFAYNGGPGSASLWLHMGALGPRRVAMNDDGTMPKPPFRTVDNAETWLAFADIVMVDAPGTGYSRLEKDDIARRVYGVRGDIESFGRFVQGWLQANGRYGSPVFLAGESYGGIRTAGLSNWLLQNGVALNGAIVISGTMSYATLDAARGNDLPYQGFLPTFATTAWYHRKLSPALQRKSVEEVAKEAAAFAGGPYAAALNAGTSLPEAEIVRVARRYAELTGLDATYVRRANLRVSDGQFYKELLRDRGRTVGRLDARLTGQDANDLDGPEDDPSMTAITPPFVSAYKDYIGRELGYPTSDRFRIFNDTTGGPWQGTSRDAYTDTSEDLRQAMTRNPYMRVLFACGYYDLACPWYATKWTVDHMDLRKPQLDRIEWAYYPAGHMMYTERGSRVKLRDDVARFVAAAK